MSTNFHYMALHDKTELLDTSTAGVVEMRAGTCMIEFLDVDWQGYYQACQKLLSTYNIQSSDLENLYTTLKKDISPRHPLLREFLEEQLICAFLAYGMEQQLDPSDPVFGFADSLRKSTDVPSLPHDILYPLVSDISRYMNKFYRFKDRLIDLVEQMQNIEFGDTRLTVAQRYAIMRECKLDYLAMCSELYPKLLIEYRIVKNNRVLPISMPSRVLSQKDLDRFAGHSVSAHAFCATNHLPALVFWEFDYLATQQIEVRRCDYCNRYFLPYSVAARYCDRPLADYPDRTCKDIAALKKHQLNVKNDEARALYQKVNNRNQMRARRRKEASPTALDDYRKWQFEAKQKLEQVQAGEIGFREFEGWMEN